MFSDIERFFRRYILRKPQVNKFWKQLEFSALEKLPAISASLQKAPEFQKKIKTKEFKTDWKFSYGVLRTAFYVSRVTSWANFSKSFRKRRSWNNFPRNLVEKLSKLIVFYGSGASVWEYLYIFLKNICFIPIFGLWTTSCQTSGKNFSTGLRKLLSTCPNEQFEEK